MSEPGKITRLQAVFEEALQMPAPAAHDDMIAAGLLDSLGLVTLLFEIEQAFGVQIALETLDLEDVRTLDRLAALVDVAPPDGPTGAQLNGHGPTAS